MIYLFVFIFKWYPIILCINAITVVTITRGKQAFTFTVVNLHHWMKIKRFKSWMHILSLIYQDKIRDVWSSSNSSVRIHWPLECLKSFFFFVNLGYLQVGSQRPISLDTEIHLRADLSQHMFFLYAETYGWNF